jgi:ANTAR domain
MQDHFISEHFFVLSSLSRVVAANGSFAGALHRISRILWEHSRFVSLRVETQGERQWAFSRSEDAGFEKPYRALFSIPLRDLGVLQLQFASESFEGDYPRQLATFLGQQISVLLVAEKLQQEQDDLLIQLAVDEEDLRARKWGSRAKALLAAKHGMSELEAEQWLHLQRQKTGLSPAQVADRLITYHHVFGPDQDRKSA